MKQETLKIELSDNELEGITGGTLEDFIDGAYFSSLLTPKMVISGEDILGEIMLEDDNTQLNASERAGLATGFAAIMASGIAIEHACCWAYKKLKKA